MTANESARLASSALAFETEALRKGIKKFFSTIFPGTGQKISSYKWGVYAFFDYDREPIYVGQTKEGLQTRIRRHLTNQRTDAVAMNVLDPFEVFEVEVWPLPEQINKHPSVLEKDLNALERAVWEYAITESRFNAILNEKNPPPIGNAELKVHNLPPSFRGVIVSPQVDELRGHPDVRIARRAETVARLARVVVERQVSGGLRRTLATQSRRLSWLAGERFAALGGDKMVESGSEEAPEPHDGGSEPDRE